MYSYKKYVMTQIPYNCRKDININTGEIAWSGKLIINLLLSFQMVSLKN